VNFEEWPTPQSKLADQELERDFDLLLKYVSLTHSARQAAKLKRRWPLRRAVLAGPRDAQNAVKKLQDLFLELANVKNVEYSDGLKSLKSDMQKTSSLASENSLHVMLDIHRDEALQGEGLMRDIARRVQALRRALGFKPTKILEVVYVAELNAESTKLLKPHLRNMAELVRAKKIHLQKDRNEIKTDWQEYKLDSKKIYISIP
jgi:hypothetical protein